MSLPTHTMKLMSIVGLLLAIAGCSSSSGVSRQSEAHLLRENPIGIVLRADTINMSYTVIVESVDATRLKGASQVILQVYHDVKRQEIPMLITSMGAPGRSETITTMITCTIPSANLRSFDSLGISARLDDGDHNFSVTVKNASAYGPSGVTADPAPSDTAAVQLLVSYRRNPDSTFTFTARALRRRTVEGEYFPSSEHLRLRMINGKGQIVWSTNTGMAFLTMVSPVEPAAVGSVHDYEADWDGRDEDGQTLPGGSYRMEVVLPSKPVPYVTVVDLKLPLP